MERNIKIGYVKCLPNGKQIKGVMYFPKAYNGKVVHIEVLNEPKEKEKGLISFEEAQKKTYQIKKGIIFFPKCMIGARIRVYYIYHADDSGEEIPTYIEGNNLYSLV